MHSTSTLMPYIRVRPMTVTGTTSSSPFRKPLKPEPVVANRDWRPTAMVTQFGPPSCVSECRPKKALKRSASKPAGIARSVFESANWVFWSMSARL